MQRHNYPINDRLPKENWKKNPYNSLERSQPLGYSKYRLKYLNAYAQTVKNKKSQARRKLVSVPKSPKQKKNSDYFGIDVKDPKEPRMQKHQINKQTN